MRSRIVRWSVLAPLFCLALPANLLAQEHPSEHPKSAEHPKGAVLGVTKAELGSAVEAYIKEEMVKGGGAWVVEDAEDGITLKLTLDKVHKDKLATTAKDTYFACADLKNTDGHIYDLDVFMTGPDKDHLKATQVSVHKKDGTERYTWTQEGGVWTKQPIEKSKG